MPYPPLRGYFPTAVGKLWEMRHFQKAPHRSGELSAKLTEGRLFPIHYVMDKPFLLRYNV